MYWKSIYSFGDVYHMYWIAERVTRIFGVGRVWVED